MPAPLDPARAARARRPWRRRQGALVAIEPLSDHTPIPAGSPERTRPRQPRTTKKSSARRAFASAVRARGLDRARRRQQRNRLQQEEIPMKKTKITRRRFVATTAAASATMIAAPFVRTANAAGKLSIGFWDHWVPGANKTLTSPVQGMGGQGEGRGPDRLHHLAGQQEPADDRRRGAGEVRPRHPGAADLVGRRTRRRTWSPSTTSWSR